MWKLRIDKGDAVTHDIYNLISPKGEVFYAGVDVSEALRIWHTSGAPWLEIGLGNVNVYCAHIPEMT